MAAGFQRAAGPSRRDHPCTAQVVAAHHRGLVGITASSSQYGFLELPHLAGLREGIAALSPDGLHVAYWMEGQPQASPNTQMVGAAVVGVAIYDVTTGQVEESRIRTQHGLNPSGLLWTDDRTLVFAVGQIRGPHGDPERGNQAKTSGPPQVWRLDSPAPTRLRLSGYRVRDLFDVPGVDGRLVLRDQDRSARMVSLGHGVSGLNAGDFAKVAVSPGLQRFAAMPGDSSPNPIEIARLTVTSDGRISAVGSVTSTRSVRYSDVLTWLDDDRVIAVRLNPFSRSRSGGDFAIVEIDVRSGQTTTLIDPVTMGDVDFADGLLGAPVAHADPPPDPWGSRVELSMLIPVLAVFGIVAWSYRVRRR